MRDDVPKLRNNKIKNIKSKIANNYHKEPLHEKLTKIENKLDFMCSRWDDSLFNYVSDEHMPFSLHRRIYLHWLDKQVNYYEWIQKVYYDEKK